MKRILFIAVAITGCVIKDPGYSLFLGSNIAPSQPPTCTYESTSTTIIPFGILDLVRSKASCFVDSSVPCYSYNPALKNQMLSVATDTDGFSGTFTEVRADANNVEIEGFYMTYEVGDNPHPDTDGQDLPGPHAFVGSNGAVVPPGGITAVSVDLLPASVLQDMVNDNGANFRVYVHVKASSRTGDGRIIGSNEVIYMVDICTACLTSCPQGYTAVAGSVCIDGQDQSIGCALATP